MGGHIAADVHAFFPAILLGIRESFIQSPVVKVVLELVGEIGILRTLVLRSPREAIVVLPLALERLAVTAPSPELRFLEKNGVDTCIDDRFDVPFLEVSEVVFGGDDVTIGACVSPKSKTVYRIAVVYTNISDYSRKDIDIKKELLKTSFINKYGFYPIEDDEFTSWYFDYGTIHIKTEYSGSTKIIIWYCDSLAEEKYKREQESDY